MTTVLTPHSANQSASRCRSAVKVPKLRTGSDARSAPTAATCMVAPISMAAAFGLTTASPESAACDFALRFISILLLTKAEGLGCAVDQFPKRDRPKTSPLSSSQQPMDHVFLRGHSPPKSGRPLPSAARIEHNSFYPHRRPRSATVFLEFYDRFGALQPLLQPEGLPPRADAASPTALTSKAPRGARSRRPLRGRPRRGRPPQGCATCLAPRMCGDGDGPKVQATQQPALKRSSASGRPPYQRRLLQESCCL